MAAIAKLLATYSPAIAASLADFHDTLQVGARGATTAARRRRALACSRIPDPRIVGLLSLASSARRARDAPHHDGRAREGPARRVRAARRARRALPHARLVVGDEAEPSLRVRRALPAHAVARARAAVLLAARRRRARAGGPLARVEEEAANLAAHRRMLGEFFAGALSALAAMAARASRGSIRSRSTTSWPSSRTRASRPCAAGRRSSRRRSPTGRRRCTSRATGPCRPPRSSGRERGARARLERTKRLSLSLSLSDERARARSPGVRAIRTSCARSRGAGAAEARLLGLGVDGARHGRGDGARSRRGRDGGGRARDRARRLGRHLRREPPPFARCASTRRSARALLQRLAPARVALPAVRVRGPPRRSPGRSPPCSAAASRRSRPSARGASVDASRTHALLENVRARHASESTRRASFSQVDARLHRPVLLGAPRRRAARRRIRLLRALRASARPRSARAIRSASRTTPCARARGRSAPRSPPSAAGAAAAPDVVAEVARQRLLARRRPPPERHARAGLRAAADARAAAARPLASACSARTAARRSTATERAAARSRARARGRARVVRRRLQSPRALGERARRARARRARSGTAGVAPREPLARASRSASRAPRTGWGRIGRRGGAGDEFANGRRPGGGGGGRAAETGAGAARAYSGLRAGSPPRAHSAAGQRHARHARAPMRAPLRVLADAAVRARASRGAPFSPRVVHLHEVLPALGEGRREEVGEEALDEREHEDVAHRRERDDEDDHDRHERRDVLGRAAQRAHLARAQRLARRQRGLSERQERARATPRVSERERSGHREGKRSRRETGTFFSPLEDVITLSTSPTA